MEVEPFLVKYIGDEREFYPNEKSIFACSKCGSYDIEEDAYKKLETLLEQYKIKFGAYINYYLASRGAGGPKYNLVFIDFICSKCNENHKAFFYIQFRGNYFPDAPREFFLADINNQTLEENVDGVYSRATCQIFMKKFFIRWYILKDITYIVVPFVGNTYQSSEERLDLLGEFLLQLHPSKTLWITRTTTVTLLKSDFDTHFGAGTYAKLKEYGKINPILENAFLKQNFHAKFYCGISPTGVEILSGSHNLHGGNSLENIMLKHYTMDKFIDRYLMQIGVMVIPQTKPTIEALIFDREKELHVDTFTGNAMNLLAKYNG